MFITFEGIDGSGKTTQIKLLQDYIKSLGNQTVIIREPGGTPFSEIIRDILLNKDIEINPVSELLLFEAARANLTQQVIIPALKNGFYVLCDRFYDSTTAYQGYGRQLNLDEVLNCHKLATLGLKPDLTFYLKLSLDESLKRSAHKKADRMERAGREFFLRVLDGYDAIAESEPERFVIIDAAGDIEETHRKIVSFITRKSPNK
ncbi:MAG: dTMP kinase [Desulfobulbaceae bacterium]|nr:dTMP kinase [Desulfobulbaceae bacterium]